DGRGKAGRLRYIGHSNFSGWQTVEAHYLADQMHATHFVSAQNEYSLLNRAVEKELVPACQKYGVGILPYFPRASGCLTGKYRRGQEPPEGTRLAAWSRSPMAGRIMNDRNYDILEGLEAFAEARGHTGLEPAMGRLASKAYIPSVIAGATSPEQVEQNANAVAWRLTPEEQTEV